jgi:hypothetical protein
MLLKYIFGIVVFFASITVGADFLLYLFLSPRCTIFVLLLLFAIWVSLHLLSLRIATKWVHFELCILIVYTLFVFIAGALIDTVERLKWHYTHASLYLTGQALLRYHDQHGYFPVSLAEIPEISKGIRDPFQDNGIFGYHCLDSNTCKVYSFGPDRINDNGEKSLSKNAIRYSAHEAPWSFMPFRSIILYLSGFNEELKGDIVHFVRRDEGDATTQLPSQGYR